MKSLLNQRGQGLVETLIALPLMFSCGFILITLLYRALVFFLVDYHLHEALLCSGTHSIKTCTTELQERIKPVLMRSSSVKISILKSPMGGRGKVDVDLTPPLKIEKNYRKGSL